MQRTLCQWKCLSILPGDEIPQDSSRQTQKGLILYAPTICGCGGELGQVGVGDGSEVEFVIHFFLSLLTVHLPRAHLAAPAGQQHRVVAGRRRALRLDVLATHPPHDPALLVDLQSREDGQFE